MAYDWQQCLIAAASELASFAQRLESLEAQVQQLSDENRALREEFERVRAVPAATPSAGTTLSAPIRVESADPLDAPVHTSELDTSRLFRGYSAGEPPARSYGGGDAREYDHAAGATEVPRRPFVKWVPTTDAELPMIESRCRLKAAACRWAEQRRRLLSQAIDYRTEIEPKDRDLISQAKQLPDCFLWMCHSSGPNPADPSQWLVLAGCYEVLADAVAMIRKLLEDTEETSESFEQAVDLLAEAQSALRVAVTSLEGPPTDHDQARVFGWLKNIATQRAIFIRRYMRLDDPADPTHWSELATRISECLSQWEEGRRKLLHRRRTLGRVRYKLSQLKLLSPDDTGPAWKSIADDIDEIVRSGMPPSNVELRDLLIEHLEQLPELAEMPKGFQLTVREIDRYLASSPSRADEDDDSAPESVELLDDVAAMLAGRAMVLIGGDRRPHAAEALERAFQLSELIWIDTRAHESTAGFEPYVARPEVAMVLLAIRWSSHSYGEVQDFCRQYGKPLVRLPGGYNPRQVAAQILQQCSERLVAQ